MIIHNYKYKSYKDESSPLSDVIKGVLDYSAPTPSSWDNGNVVHIDIPDVEKMTKDEAERWIIQNNLLTTDVIRQMTADVIRNYLNEQGDTIGSEPPETNVTTPVVATPKMEGRRFKVGEHYIIYPFKNKKLKREYVVKKTIYNIEDYEVRILIMKQVKGDYHTKYTLNRMDCLMFHIKYEEGLEVFSMDLDWKLMNKKEKKS